MRKFNSAMLITLILTILLPVTVFAHLDLESSFPGSGDTLEVSPKKIQLWFNKELDSFESSLLEFDSSGERIDNGDYQVKSDDRREIHVSLPINLPPDTYTIKWSAVDDMDGHPIEGEIQFTIRDLSSQPNQQYISSSNVIVGFLLLSVIVIFFIAMLRNKRKIN